MFSNIGKKIKFLAKLIFWIDVVLVFALAISFFAQVGQSWLFLIYGLLSLLLGPLFAWFSSCLLYSWGEIVDNLRAIKEKQCGKNVDADENEKICSFTGKFFKNLFNHKAVSKKENLANLSQNKLEKLLMSGQITFDEYNNSFAKK